MLKIDYELLLDTIYESFKNNHGESLVIRIRDKHTWKYILLSATLDEKNLPFFKCSVSYSCKDRIRFDSNDLMDMINFKGTKRLYGYFFKLNVSLNESIQIFVCRQRLEKPHERIETIKEIENDKSIITIFRGFFQDEKSLARK